MSERAKLEAGEEAPHHATDRTDRNMPRCRRSGANRGKSEQPHPNGGIKGSTRAASWSAIGGPGCEESSNGADMSSRMLPEASRMSPSFPKPLKISNKPGWQKSDTNDGRPKRPRLNTKGWLPW